MDDTTNGMVAEPIVKTRPKTREARMVELQTKAFEIKTVPCLRAARRKQTTDRNLGVLEPGAKPITIKSLANDGVSPAEKSILVALCHRFHEHRSPRGNSVPAATVSHGEIARMTSLSRTQVSRLIGAKQRGLVARGFLKILTKQRGSMPATLGLMEDVWTKRRWTPEDDDAA